MNGIAILVKKMINKTKILIIGANGYLGARLFFDLKDKFDVVGTYHKNKLSKDFIKLDITDKKNIEKVFEKNNPDIIIQTANYPSSRFAKDNKEGYENLNLKSTEYIRNAAEKISAKLIFISSFAALNPDNIYGKLKQKSEIIVQESKIDYLIIRPSLILGVSPSTKNDRPFDRILKHLDGKTVAEFDVSWKFRPTYIGHISKIIETCIDKKIFNRIIHVTCPSIETQYSTAKDILKPYDIEVRKTDKKINIPIQKTNERELLDLGLPTCSYAEMISKIHSETENRNKYRLS